MYERPLTTHSTPLAELLPARLPGVDDGGLALYRAIAERLPRGAIFVVDHDLRYLLACGASLEEAGYVPEDFEGRRLDEALPADLLEQYTRDYRAILNGEPMERQHRVNGRDFASHGVPLADADGDVRAALVVSYDVTERLAIERRLAALDALADALAVARDALDVERAAAALLCAYLGDVRCAFAGGASPTLELGPERIGLADFGNAVAARLHAGEVVSCADAAADPKATASLPPSLPPSLRSWVLCPHLAGGELAGLTLVAAAAPRSWSEDELQLMCELADRAWAHIERLRVLAALREADRQKDRFLAVLAHELRNPLAVARQGVALLKLPESRTSPERIVDLMEQQLAHMGRLIEDVLDASYICHGRIGLRPERLALREVVQGAVEAARTLACKSGHVLEAELGDEALPMEGDPTRLAQAIGNILANAIKYTPAPGTIRVRLVREGGRALVRIADDGRGMSPETLAHLFDLFARGSDSGAALHPGGLGVGMWITRQLVEAHGGSVRAASGGPGQGSEFTIVLPLAATGAKQTGDE